MQYNTPPARAARNDMTTPSSRRPQKDYKLSKKRKKNKSLSVVPLLILFVVALALMYFIFPKEAGRHVGSTVYDGLIISEVMAANSSAVPDENGEVYKVYVKFEVIFFFVITNRLKFFKKRFRFFDGRIYFNP